MASTPNTIAIARALRLIRAHDAVASVVVESESTGGVLATVEVKTELPSEWRAAGKSPSGVRKVEPVTFRFGPRYPVQPPDIRLRADFDRSHPHLQPGSADELPEPCLFAGSPRELLRLRGILGLVEQLADWLDKAATLDLIDAKQGWEPVRRDHIEDVVVSDGAWLKSLARTDAGCSAFKVRYLALQDDGADTYWITLRRSERVALGPDISDEFTFKQIDDARTGSGIALVGWSGKKPDGSPFLADRYVPETVATMDDLLDRAKLLGCRDHLEPMLLLLQKRFRESRMKVAVPLVVVMLARRPYPVIGSQSLYELCPYVVELRGKDDLSGRSPKIVRPAMHREDISDALMRRASGEEEGGKPAPWSLVGCGSVGSKLAMHMARAGRGPTSIIDRANMLPHNYARHAVYPAGITKDFGLLGGKVALLKDALGELGVEPKGHTVDVASHVASKHSIKTLIDEGCFAFVNTTGSATVRETLGSLPHSSDRPRIVEACMLGSGDAGLMTVEGASANPSTTDMICEAYLAIHGRPDLADRIFGTEASEVAVGQGCSALTMPLRDSKLSLFAAAFAERFHRLQQEGLPKSDGMLLLGGLGPDGISQSWTERAIGPRIVSKGAGCEIRISPDVDRVIGEEVAKRPGSETGGILFGRYCDVTGHFHVVGTLPAPPDSKFSAEEFVLGTKGLKPMLRGLIEGTGGALYPLGTWHNHLIPSGPSAKDMRTAALLSGLQYFPLLMLIHTPSGYSHLTVETISDTGDLLQFRSKART
ncbi:thiamine biosynthesis protein ThiF [Bradyrhizobium sp. Bra78]|uniref:thiamine biosynthesis protein ThiF n=1 Tax=Bradyrhizobium sp. Bra78 TaxID=2926010 RepID=UPI0021C72AF1|nr:thiamine biosynthesis protein ThiF [Bradyrhizobium sp. Bra78]